MQTLCATALVLFLGAAQVKPVQPAVEAAALADFNARVKAYVALRDKADNGAPALAKSSDPAKIKAAQDALAERIRTARAGTKRGNIFTPEIQRMFLVWLRPPLKGADGAATKETIEHDNPGKLALTINGRYPDEAPLSTVPVNVLASLPQLPSSLDLEYRFVSKHLILRDTRANLIIDFIANAIR